jgi:hypothetical protein
MPPFREVSPEVPQAPQRRHQAEADLGLVLLERPTQGGPEVVVFYLDGA